MGEKLVVFLSGEGEGPSVGWRCREMGLEKLETVIGGNLGCHLYKWEGTGERMDRKELQILVN